MLKHIGVVSEWDYFVQGYIQPIKHLWSQVSSQGVAKAVIAAALTFMTTFVGDHLVAFISLCVMVIFDQITGMAVAAKNGTISSIKFRRGAIKVLCYAVIVVSFHLLELVDPFLGGMLLDRWVLMYLAATEALSVAENVANYLGIKLPEKIRETLESITKSKPEVKP